ncbi:MAG TPA: NADH-quinone oxidoreductase subunit J [Verrucomicrobiae bacterium]|jgi:NADH-quinone oxidoreductase subunit J|nr:NADH-quinone oxidoreductase subunit J [Verrucomicrobiae bacterium]
MQIAFAIIAALTLVSAVAAMSLRNLVHCALSLAVTFAGLAALYLQLGAPFVGWAQILVYIGAVAILIVFAILLTRSSEHNPEPIVSRKWGIGVAIAVMVFGILTWSVLHSSIADKLPPAKTDPTVREIGNQLMTRYVLPLEVIGLLLTAAAIGAVIIALKEPAKTATPVSPAKPAAH